MRFWFSLVLTFLSIRGAYAADLDALVREPKLWTLNQAEFEALSPTKGFRWTSESKDSARAGEQKLTLFNLPVVEVVARFEANKLTSLTPVIYARGDVGGLSEDNFKSLLVTARDAITTYTKVPATVRGKDMSNVVRAEGLIWQAPTGHYLLEYSFTKEVKVRNVPFRAEFVRLEIKPPEQKASLLANVSLAGKARFSGPAHVKKDAAGGDVLISDVPMVDQGQKGYCAVACAERMMRYYGIPADANEIAQVANSDADRGTSPEAMFEALKKLSGRLHVRVRAVEPFEVKQILALMNDYNRAAKQGKRAQPLPDQGQMLSVGAIFHEMDPTLLKEVRNKNKSEPARFLRDVQTHIDQGVPLSWSVMLGIVKEPQIPQAFGGHMRLIIGYNAKKEEIIYTDSWGAGHELKRMSLADAWTITTGLSAIEPM